MHYNVTTTCNNLGKRPQIKSGAQPTCNMIRVPLLTLTLTACAALRPFRAPQTQKDTVLGRRDLGAAAVAAVAALAPAAAHAEPRDQWIAAQKEIDAILADWPIAGGGDGIRRRIGTVGTTSPLFDIEKTCPETVWKSKKARPSSSLIRSPQAGN